MDAKLNVKRTVYIGFAFFTILMLWQVYTTYCTAFLTDLFIGKYGGAAEEYSYYVGIIMALDNVLALFMLPLFGELSDRTKSKLGKRIPYIILGTAMSVIFFPFIAIAYMSNQLIWLIIIMGLIILAMNIYRSPAVALMPDITPKPLRSKANAIINLVGYVGAVSAGVMAMLVKVGENKETGRLDYNPNTIWIPFAITAALMVVALVILILKIRENKLAVELKEEMEEGEKFADVHEDVSDDRPLNKQDKGNLYILLASIFLWFFAFNAIETFGSLFGIYFLNQETGWWGTAVIIMTFSSIVAFLPAGAIASKIGRKKSIILGLLLMLLGVVGASVISLIPALYALTALFYPFIAIAGVGWAWINVNSYPMVVELSNKNNIGKFTGWYYSASMLAQSITPIAVGFLFSWVGYQFMFIYASVFTVVALVVFMAYKSKKEDNKKPDVQKTTIEHEK